MQPPVNELGQPIGDALPDWVGAKFPKVPVMAGSYCNLELADSAKHAADLFDAYREDTECRMWTYMNYGPFASCKAITDWLDRESRNQTQVVYAIIEKATGRAVGIATYLRIQPANGVVEVGGISYSPRLQRTPIATDAMFVMMHYVFDIFGYRRYEWKCDSLNAASRRAAERYGFSYDGLFHQAAIYKGRNRDTAWYSIIDKDWPPIKGAYQAWLAPENFDANGHQRRRLADLIAVRRSVLAE